MELGIQNLLLEAEICTLCDRPSGKAQQSTLNSTSPHGLKCSAAKRSTSHSCSMYVSERTTDLSGFGTKH